MMELFLGDPHFNYEDNSINISTKHLLKGSVKSKKVNIIIMDL